MEKMDKPVVKADTNFQFGQSFYCDQQVVSKEFSQFSLLLPASADGRHKIFSTLLEFTTFYKTKGQWLSIYTRIFLA